MRFSLKSWTRRWRASRRLGARRSTKLATACASVALATAWGADAEATTIRLEVTPTETITNAFVGYYHLNDSDNTEFLIGTVPGGRTSVYFHDFPNEPREAFFGFDDAFVFAGLYGEDPDFGIALSYPDDSPITNGETWESLIESRPNGPAKDTTILRMRGLRGFSEGAFVNGQLASPYNTPTTIVLFSQATAGGQVIATIVPEPATFSVLAIAGLGLATRRVRDNDSDGDAARGNEPSGDA